MYSNERKSYPYRFNIGDNGQGENMGSARNYIENKAKEIEKDVNADAGSCGR